MPITIITVNYNNIEGLKKTMPSVFEQTWQDFEYIVIDGGSMDGSKAYIEDFNQYLSYWVSEPDQGIYHAMNKGIKVAKGDYILFLNSGDHFHSSESLQCFKPYMLGENRQDIIYGNIAVVSIKEWIKTYPDTLTLSYFMKDTLAHPATLIKTKCFYDFLYDEHLKIASDWKFFMIGILKRKFTYVHVNEVISTFYMDGISSSNPDLVQQERQQVLQGDFFWSIKFDKLKRNIIQALKSKT